LFLTGCAVQNRDNVDFLVVHPAPGFESPLDSAASKNAADVSRAAAPQELNPLMASSPSAAHMPTLWPSADTSQDAVPLLSFCVVDCAMHAALLLAHRLANNSLAPARDNVAPTPLDLLDQGAVSVPSNCALTMDAFRVLCGTHRPPSNNALVLHSNMMPPNATNQLDQLQRLNKHANSGRPPNGHSQSRSDSNYIVEFSASLHCQSFAVQLGPAG
jgi:hypothetical protein